MRRWWAAAALRALGAIWLAAWVLVLVFLFDVWSKLGGLVDERLRWWARLGLTAGPVIGLSSCGAGNSQRDPAPSTLTCDKRSSASRVRGTRWDSLFFALSAGIVHMRPDRSNSSHAAPITSPLR